MDIQLTEVVKRLDALEARYSNNKTKVRSGAATLTEDDCWLTPAAVMEIFAISQRTLARWVDDQTAGFPQPIKVNNRRFFSSKKLRAFKAKLELA